MNNYTYIDTNGATKTVQAADSASALRLAPGIGANSGVQLQSPVNGIQQTTTEARGITQERDASLNTRLSSMNSGTQLSPDNPNALNIDAKQNQTGVASNNGKPTNAAEMTLSEKYGIDAASQNLKSKAQSEINDVVSTLDNLRSSQNASTNALISSIKQIYGARIAKLEDSNNRLLETKRATGFRQGRARYAPGMEAGILTAEEQAGHERVAALEGAMLQAVAAAEQARNEGNIALFNSQFDKIDRIEKELTTQVQNLHKNALDAENAFRAKEKADREADKMALETMLDKSSNIAPALVTQLEAFKTEEEKTKFIEGVAKRTGIDIDILLGDIQDATAENSKEKLSLENIRNQISNRNKAQALASSKYYDAEEEKDTIKSIRSELLSGLQSGELTKDEALDVWVTAGGTIADFNKEFENF